MAQRARSAQRRQLLAERRRLTHPALGLDLDIPQLSQPDERQMTLAICPSQLAAHKQRPQDGLGEEQLTLGSVGLLGSSAGGTTVGVGETNEALAIAGEDFVELDRLGGGDLDRGLLLGGGAERASEGQHERSNGARRIHTPRQQQLCEMGANFSLCSANLASKEDSLFGLGLLRSGHLRRLLLGSLLLGSLLLSRLLSSSFLLSLLLRGGGPVKSRASR
jgi:hypothetical protein